MDNCGFAILDMLFDFSILIIFPKDGPPPSSQDGIKKGTSERLLNGSNPNQDATYLLKFLSSNAECQYFHFCNSFSNFNNFICSTILPSFTN